MLKKNISNNCFVDNIKLLSKSLDKIPLKISEINLEQNRIILSLKELTSSNSDRLEQFRYEDEYKAIVIGLKHNNYGVIIPNYWIEGILETNSSYSIGSEISVRPARISESEIIFTSE